MKPAFPSQAAVSVLFVAVLVAGACAGDDGGDHRSSGDPGKAGTIYGPKMGGAIELSPDELVIVFGTAAAVSKDGVNHLFMIPAFADPPAFRRAYLSIWMPGNGWAAGTFGGNTRGLGARIDLTTNDGRQYALDIVPGAGTQASFLLEVERAGSSQNDGVHYMTGRLMATLRGVSDPTQAAPLEFTINVPTD